MDLSEPLANLNYERFQNWSLPFTLQNSRQSIYAFNGDAFSGLNAQSFDDDDMIFAQEHLRILSAMYGVIRPLDLIKAYRIDMRTKFTMKKHKSLYDFWKKKISLAVHCDLDSQKDDYLINLASEEYFKTLDLSRIHAKIITPVFKDNSNGQYKIISSFAKQARGSMAKFIIKNQLKNPEELKLFDSQGYFFSERQSNGNMLIFLRG